MLLAEHRSAPGLGPVPIELSPSSDPDQVPCLRLSAEPTDQASEQDLISDRILKLLVCSAAPLTTDAIRLSLRVRKQRVVDALRRLYESGLIVRDGNKYAGRKPEDQSNGSGPDWLIE